METKDREVRAPGWRRERRVLERQPMLDRREVQTGKRLYCAAKRGQDILFSLLALLVLWPFMLLLALVIYIDSPGASPFFVQERIGLNGKPFRFIKFRSMVPDAETKLHALLDKNEMDGPAFKMKRDPRITRVGKFIRKSSLDELPQIYNVLRGDMSIVGPRPALPREVEKYDAYQRQRRLVQPGLTCYWQIQPQRNTLGFDDWIELDLKYIRERSFLTDWKIILGTFRAVIGMNGE